MYELQKAFPEDIKPVWVANNSVKFVPMDNCKKENEFCVQRKRMFEKTCKWVETTGTVWTSVSKKKEKWKQKDPRLMQSQKDVCFFTVKKPCTYRGHIQQCTVCQTI